MTRHCDVADRAGVRSSCEGELKPPAATSGNPHPKRSGRRDYIKRRCAACGGTLILDPDGRTVRLDTTRGVFRIDTSRSPGANR